MVDPDGKIREGHEKVLRARLEDSAFFWKIDRQQRLKDRVEQLDHIVFQEALGTYHAKTDRVRKLCAELEKGEHLDTAALLCKTDLTTDMVREFPELQGVMGGLYARDEGYPEEVCRAIGEHYKPVSLDDESPGSRLGALLSVADKLDTIVGCFAIGIVPTGSNDPFALRRHAQGLIKVLFDRKLDWSLRWLVERAQENFSKELEGQVITDILMDFLERRVRHIFQEKRVAYDVSQRPCWLWISRVFQMPLKEPRHWPRSKVSPILKRWRSLTREPRISWPNSQSICQKSIKRL